MWWALKKKKSKLLISFIWCWLTSFSASQSFLLTEQILEKFWCFSLLFSLCVLDHTKYFYTDFSLVHWRFCPGVIHLYLEGIKPMLHFRAVMVWVLAWYPLYFRGWNVSPSLLSVLSHLVMLSSGLQQCCLTQGSRLLVLMALSCRPYPSLWQAERVKSVHPAEEKAPGRPQNNFAAP